jgi:Outer membrane lipoprotein carrier protein LolA-like
MPRVLALIACGFCWAGGGTPSRAAPASEPARAPASAPADSQEFDQVMAVLAMRQHGQVEFIEQHFLSVLSRPIETSGELRYDAPDRLEKRTLKPHAETLVLKGDELTINRAGHLRVMDLHAYPQMVPFVESIRATLAGDRKALERLFRLDFTGSVSRWTLTLAPLESKVKQSVSQVRIDGAQDQLLRVEIRQPDGDRSLMTLRPSTLP